VAVSADHRPARPVSADYRPARPIHPLYAFFLAGTVPLFLGALLSDLGYGKTAEPQWANFAAWLLLGAMVFTGFAGLASLIGLIRVRRGWRVLAFLLLLAAFIIGFIDCFVHARDAWAIMPAAPILTAIATVIVILATLVGFSSLRARDVK
jgi:uncharacterized membrane protein